MEKIVGIYKITCLKNNVCYIGQSVDVLRRISQHKTKLKNNYHNNKYLQNLYNKYGLNNFSFEIIAKCPIEQLDELERFFINQVGGVNSKSNCNWESGGHSLKRYSKELKKRQSISHKGQRTSKETEFSKGHIPWNKGKKATQTACENQRKSHLGFKVKEETKRKISQTSKGKCLGKERYNSKPVVAIDDFGNIVNEYECLAQAGRENHLAPNSIVKAIKKKGKSRNYYWNWR